MTPAEFRALALALPGSVEGAHMGHPDFRVGGHVFASLQPGGEKGMVLLTPDDQVRFADEDPDVFQPGPGAWGRNGATGVYLPSASKARVVAALRAAFENRSEKNRARRKPRKR